MSFQTSTDHLHACALSARTHWFLSDGTRGNCHVHICEVSSPPHGLGWVERFLPFCQMGAGRGWSGVAQAARSRRTTADAQAAIRVQVPSDAPHRLAWVERFLLFCQTVPVGGGPSAQSSGGSSSQKAAPAAKRVLLLAADAAQFAGRGVGGLRLPAFKQYHARKPDFIAQFATLRGCKSKGSGTQRWSAIISAPFPGRRYSPGSMGFAIPDCAAASGVGVAGAQ